MMDFKLNSKYPTHISFRRGKVDCSAPSIGRVRNLQDGRWYSSTHADRCVLHYGLSKLSKIDNVATFFTTPGFKKIKRIKKDNLITNHIKAKDDDEDTLRCEVAIAGNSPRRYWSIRSGLPISKKQAQREEIMYQNKHDQTRMDLSGLDSTDDLHRETQGEYKDQSLQDELLNYHKSF